MIERVGKPSGNMAQPPPTSGAKKRRSVAPFRPGGAGGEARPMRGEYGIYQVCTYDEH